MDTEKRIPRFPGRLLGMLMPYMDSPFLEGDFEELYYAVLEDKGRVRSYFWLWAQVLKSVPGFLRESYYGRMSMFKNYMKIAFRIFIRNKLYTIVNVFGLSIGFASAAFIFLYIQDELTYDSFHKNSDRIYRITGEMGNDDRIYRNPTTSFPTAPLMKEEFPDILTAIRFASKGERIIQYEEKRYYEQSIFFSDHDIFDVFSFDFIKGDPVTALIEPNTAVISKTAAFKYFNDENPIGKTIEYDNRIPIRITGIVEDIPYNTDVRFDFLISIKTLEKFTRMDIFFQFPSNTTYILVPEGFDKRAFEKKLPEFVMRHGGEYINRTGFKYKYHVQPLKSVHLDQEFSESGNEPMMIIYILAIVAVLILIAGSVNFMNLTIARSSRRTREIGIRKIAGAIKTQLISQITAESLFISFMAFIISTLIVIIGLPYLNNFAGKSIILISGENIRFFIFILVVAISTALFSSVYPAFILSAHRPVDLFRKSGASSRSGSGFKRILMLIQFSITTILMISTLIINDQMYFIRHKELGFNKDQVLYLRINDNVNRNVKTLANSLLSVPGVSNVSFSSRIPATGWNDSWPVIPEGHLSRFQLETYFIDYNYFRTLEFEIVAGREFSEKFSSDVQEAFLINEAAVSKFGWKDADNALGKEIRFGSDLRISRVIGVVKDFNDTSLREEIKPAIFIPVTEGVEPGWFKSNLNFAAIRINTGDIQDTINRLSKVWESTVPELPFNYSFIEESFDRLHINDRKMGNIFKCFSCIAVFIASLGMFGLATFTAENKTKEIGIRKVLGSSVSSIIIMISKNFISLITVANIISWPLSFILMENWLEGFYYRTGVRNDVFIYSLIIGILIVFFSVAYQAFKAARTNPINSLRYE